MSHECRLRRPSCYAPNQETGAEVSMYIEDANKLHQSEKSSLKATVYEESL